MNIHIDCPIDPKKYWEAIRRKKITQEAIAAASGTRGCNLSRMVNREFPRFPSEIVMVIYEKFNIQYREYAGDSAADLDYQVHIEDYKALKKKMKMYAPLSVWSVLCGYNRDYLACQLSESRWGRINAAAKQRIDHILDALERAQEEEQISLTFDDLPVEEVTEEEPTPVEAESAQEQRETTIDDIEELKSRYKELCDIVEDHVKREGPAYSDALGGTLDSCPFCGGLAQAQVKDIGYRVSCMRCGANIFKKNPAEALSAWNDGRHDYWLGRVSAFIEGRKE